MLSAAPTYRLSSLEIATLMQRICNHLGIAFSANRVFPSLSDAKHDGDWTNEVEALNIIGKHFGIRFREMTGSMRELMELVDENGVLLARTKPNKESDSDGSLLILEQRRNRFLVNYLGEDRRVSAAWLRKRLFRDKEAGSCFQWLLIQPLLAANNASRFQFETGTTDKPLKPLQRFFSILKPEAQDIRAIFIFSVVIGLLSLTTPLAVEAIVNTIAFGSYIQPLIVLSLIVLTFLGFRAGLTVLMTMVAEIIQRKLFVRTVEDLSYRLTRVPLTTWTKYHGPELVNRFFDITSVQKITSKLLLDTLMLGLQTIIGLSVLAFYHPFLLGYDIGLLTMMAVVLWLFGRGAIKTATAESQMKYETAAWLQEIVRHPTTFKFNGGLGFALNRADELAAQYIQHRRDHFGILIKQISFSMMMQVVAATTLLALGGYLVIDQQMTLGQLVAAELIVTVILGSFAKIGKDLESFYDLMASVDKLGKLFDLPVEPTNKLSLVKQPGSYELSFVGLTVKGHSEELNIEFPSSGFYALYGGSDLFRGKLIDLMIGQEKPVNGFVSLNEYRVDSISSESLQEKISLVREIEIFEGTVEENLRMGREDIGSADIHSTISRLGMRQTLAALPEGLGTRMQICGRPFSQSQAIRLVLARALITKPGILFIDGLLDRLSDDETMEVLNYLDSFTSDTTLIVSTGRKMISRWATETLDLSKKSWYLAKFDG